MCDYVVRAATGESQGCNIVPRNEFETMYVKRVQGIWFWLLPQSVFRHGSFASKFDDLQRDWYSHTDYSLSLLLFARSLECLDRSGQARDVVMSESVFFYYIFSFSSRSDTLSGSAVQYSIQNGVRGDLSPKKRTKWSISSNPSPNPQKIVRVRYRGTTGSS